MANGFMEDYDDRAPSPGEAKAARKLVADAQALADVRTLDDWAREHKTSQPFATRPHVSGRWVCASASHARKFYGDSPDEARAKAAAWVREQKR